MDPRDHLYRAAVAAVAEYASRYLEKTPSRTSALFGAAWVEELVTGHQTRSLEQARMEMEKFEEFSSLCRRRGLLDDTSGVDIEEQLMIFMFIVGQAQSNRAAQERFQHSGETISAYFHLVLNAFVSLYDDFVQLPNGDAVQVKIRSDRRFYSYFKDCVRAIDDTHIPVTVPAAYHGRFRNRKYTLSQNVFAAYGFGLSFQYILAGCRAQRATAAYLLMLSTEGSAFPATSILGGCWLRKR
uniref:DUF8040 domain-containing protein n=1 Tax=Hyaloperonospora arabidopsidis (strain Emoy2) TaxID=559515 RepID=M4C679_HYAAE